MRFSSSSVMMSKTLTTLTTPLTLPLRAISEARCASREVTRPIKYTMPRSTTTLKALDCKSLASTIKALIWPMVMMSLERCVSELAGSMARSLTTELTFSWLLANLSARSLSAAELTSPVRSTMRL